MAEHEHTLQFKLPNQEWMYVKFHSPWTESTERLEVAKQIIASDVTDQRKLSGLLKLFSPDIYQSEVGTVKTILEPH